MAQVLTDLAAAVGARVALRAAGAESARVTKVFASDKISELLHHGAPGTLLVTGLANTHLLRAAGLVEAPAICLTGGREPSPELIDAAREHGVTLMVADGTLAETAETLNRALEVAAPENGGPGTEDQGPGRKTTVTAGGGGCAVAQARCAAPGTADGGCRQDAGATSGCSASTPGG